MTPYYKLLAATKIAGYTTDDADDIHHVVEFDTHFVFIALDANEGTYMVGRFNKASPGLSADFNSCPIFEGTWDECVLFLQNHLRSTCLTIINE